MHPDQWGLHEQILALMSLAISHEESQQHGATGNLVPLSTYMIRNEPTMRKNLRLAREKPEIDRGKTW
jgi:hypothetical protein